MYSQCGSDQGMGWILVVHPGRCLRIVSVYQVSQPEGVRAGSACVGGCERRTREGCSEIENEFFRHHGVGRVGFGSGIRWFMVF